MCVEIITSDLNNNVAVARLSGKIDMGQAMAIWPVVEKAMGGCDGGMIVDMGAVAFIASEGIRTLMRAKQAADVAGKRIALIRPRPEIHRIFKIAHLDEVFAFFENESEAIDAFTSQP